MKIAPLLRTSILAGSLIAPAIFATKPVSATIVCCPNTDNQQPGSPVIPPEFDDTNPPYPGDDSVRDNRQNGVQGPGSTNTPTGTSGGPGNQNGPGNNVCCPQQ